VWTYAGPPQNTITLQSAYSSHYFPYHNPRQDSNCRALISTCNADATHLTDSMSELDTRCDACTSTGSSQCASCKPVVVSLGHTRNSLMLTLPSTAVQRVKRSTGRSTRSAANRPSAKVVGILLGIARVGTQYGLAETSLPISTIPSERTSTCGAICWPLIYCSWDRTRASVTKKAFVCYSPVVIALY
jgi:hypothetical protein